MELEKSCWAIPRLMRNNVSIDRGGGCLRVQLRYAGESYKSWDVSEGNDTKAEASGVAHCIGSPHGHW